MGAKPSRRKREGAEAPSEQKRDDPEAEVDTMPVEEASQVDIIPRDLTTQSAVKEEPEDVLNKSIKTVEARMASVSMEDPTELVTAVPEPDAKHKSLTGFSQEASTKIEFSIPESPADTAPIPSKPLTTEDQSVLEAPEHGAEAAVGDVEALVMKNEAVSGQEVSESEELLVCANQDEA